MTFSAGGQDTVVKQTAIRDGDLLLVVSGPPSLVDLHVDKALVKRQQHAERLRDRGAADSTAVHKRERARYWA
ncbi:hypothetical protein [Streptomyces collinus]|uniref:hypothetical protein n=1 Tax=Streptomyces collinus TaxID=42684 RepID=UPI0037D1D2BC